MSQLLPKRYVQFDSQKTSMLIFATMFFV